ncbi:MAG: transposase [Deltaproteobacteria bacterium]|nr:transposase [Deltaproteobacteria bacterium]
MFLRNHRGAGRPGVNDPRFIEAVLWWRRTGVSWRDLPDAFGPWQTVFSRFDRWSKAGKWLRLLDALKTDGRHVTMGIAPARADRVTLARLFTEYLRTGKWPVKKATPSS